MTVCPKCKGEAEYFKEVFNDGKRRREILVECDMCHGTGEVQTNEEYIRSCSTEELPKALKKMFFDIKSRVRSELGGYNELMKSERYFDEWLMEIHE